MVYGTNVNAIVLLPRIRTPKRRVSFGDTHEALGGVGVVGVEVWVVGFGQFVELLLDVGWGCGGGEAEGEVVGGRTVISASNRAVEVLAPL